MRLFIAVELPPTLLDVAGHVSQQLQQRVSALTPRPRLTWIPTERMHLTIRFLGNVDGQRLGALEAALVASADATGPFAVTLGQPGAFPEHGAPRVLWLGIDEGQGRLQAIEQSVSLRLESLGIERESRPFSPHLTLARARERLGLRAPALLHGVATPEHPAGRVDAITLFESRLSPKGPTYTPLVRVSLRQA